MHCGGSDAFSGVTEVRDGIHLLTPRAENEQIAKDLIKMLIK